MSRNKIITMFLSVSLIWGILSSSSMVAYAWSNTDTSAAIGILGKIIGNSSSKKEKEQQTIPKEFKQTTHRKNLSFNEKMFMEAIKNSDGKTVIEMINAGVDINAIYDDHPYLTTPLGWAIRCKNRDMQQLLLSNGADVRGYVDGKRKFSYLCDAAKRGDLELFKYLHNWGADINEINIYVSYNDKRSTRIDNSLTSLLYMSGNYGASSGILAPNNGDTNEYLLEMVCYMIDEGIDPNFIQKDYINKRYDSSLGIAANLGHHLGRINAMQIIRPEIKRAIIKRLLDAGADANFKNSEGKNAAEILLNCSHPADIEGVKLIQSYMK